MGLLKMPKIIGTWEFPAQQRLITVPTRPSPRSPTKQSPRSAPPPTAPRVPFVRAPKQVASELSVLMMKLEADYTMSDEAREKWKCLIREGSLIEAWLDRMLTTTDGEVRGLQDYGLSRLQLAVSGLSEIQVDRAYRMLYVYSVGCNEMIKELCLHSVERSLLVGCFWRAFIRLCEEHSKIDLQAEIAELVEEKQSALDELRLARGCLNDALDDLAFNKLLAHEHAEVADASVADGSTLKENEQANNNNGKPKSVDSQLEGLVEKCESLSREREELSFQLEETSRALRSERSALNITSAKEREKSAKVTQLEDKLLRAQEALDKERLEAHSLREQIRKLENDVEETERKTGDITWKFVQYEREFPILQKEVAENRHRAQQLEVINEQAEQERAILKERVQRQEEMLSRMRRQLDTYENAVRDLKEEASQRRRLFEDKAREASLNGEEAEAWIKGHEALLQQQHALLAQVETLRGTLKTERAQRSKEKYNLERTVRLQQENMRALTVGIAALTPRPVKKPTVTISPEVNVEPEQSRLERRMSRRLSRRISRRGTELGRRASEFVKLQQMSQGVTPDRGTSDLFELPEQTSDEEWDDLCSELSQQREEIEKLEGSLIEERDRRLWMERQVEDSVKQVEKLQLEVDEINLRVINLAVEKKSKERNLQVAEEQIRKLDRQLENLELVVDKKNTEIESLKNVIGQEVQRQAGCAANCKQLLAAGAKTMENRMIRDVEIVAERTSSMMENVRLMRNRMNKAVGEVRSWKIKMKNVDGQNAAMQAEVKTLKADLEAATAENISLGLRLQKEEQARARADGELTGLMTTAKDAKLELAVLEVELEKTMKEKDQRELECKKLRVKFNECMQNLNTLQSHKEKEDTIRSILQADVDALRLQLEALRRLIPVGGTSPR